MGVSGCMCLYLCCVYKYWVRVGVWNDIIKVGRGEVL